MTLDHLAGLDWGKGVPTTVKGATNYERLKSVAAMVQQSYTVLGATAVLSAVVGKCWMYSLQVPNVTEAMKGCRICFEVLPRLEKGDQRGYTVPLLLKFNDGIVQFPGYFRAVLARESPYFKNLFYRDENRKQPYEFKTISSDIFQPMLDIALSCEASAFSSIDIKLLAHFISVASLFEMRKAVKMCREVLAEKIDNLTLSLEDWKIGCQLYPFLEKDHELRLALENYFNRHMIQQITYSQLKVFLQNHGREIPTLNLPFDLTDQQLKELTSFCPIVRAVFLKSKNITDQGIESLCLNCPLLKRLSLDGCPVSKNGLMPLQRLTHLEDLSLLSIKNVEDDGFSFLASLIYLQNLTLLGCKTTDTTLTYIQYLYRLEKLFLVGGVLTHSGFARLSLLSLTQLQIMKCPSLTDEHLAFFPRNLRTLSLRDCRSLTPAAISSLSVFSNLENLDIGRTNMLCEYHASTRLFSRLTSLRQLDVTGCALAKEVRGFILPLAHLQSLIATDCDLTDDDLALISLNKNLAMLDLAGCSRITDIGLIYLENLTNLNLLVLTRCKQITAKGSSTLSGFKRLRLILDPESHPPKRTRNS